MVVLKCVGGAIVGLLIGCVCCLLLTFVIFLISAAFIGDPEGERVLMQWFGYACSLLVIAGTGIGITIPIVAEIQKQKAETKAWREQKQLQHELYAMEQETLRKALGDDVSQSTEMANRLPHLARKANFELDNAEREFEDGVFAPFWDAIERAATDLATFAAWTDAIIQHAKHYQATVPKFEGIAPRFQIGINTLPDASHVANRMRAIVRRAQKNFQFATIYEQRKTNQLLIAGFNNLGDAICGLEGRLDSSLEQLSSAVAVGFSEMTETLSDELQLSRDQAEEESTERRKHEKAIREMLENIQHRRKPRRPFGS